MTHIQSVDYLLFLIDQKTDWAIDSIVWVTLIHTHTHTHTHTPTHPHSHTHPHTPHTHTHTHRIVWCIGFSGCGPI